MQKEKAPQVHTVTYCLYLMRYTDIHWLLEFVNK